MTKQAFLDALRQRLGGLPPEDVQQSLEFYAEAIDDRMEEELSEEDAVAAVGTVEEVAVQIVAETPLVRLVKTSVKPRRALRAWEIVLIVLGAPIWIPLFLAAICASLAVYATIWIVVIALFAVCASLIGMGVGGIVAAGVFLLTGYAVSAAFVCGAGLVCIGLAILLIVEGGQVTKGVLQLSRNILLGIKSRWIRKGEAA